ncbi:MAG: ERAP1-like C-terminal domain-containing protein [Cyanobacteria bacterium J06648_11]
MTETTFELPLDQTDTCPAYILPNANGAGYYRWSLPAENWVALTRAFNRLNASEALSAIDSAVAAFTAGEGNVESMLSVLRAAAQYKDRRVSIAPMIVIQRFIKLLESTDGSDALRAFAAELYRDQFEWVRLSQRTDDAVLTAQLESFLALTAREIDIREQLAEDAARFIGLDRPRDPDALSSDRYLAALTVGVQDLGAPFQTALLAIGDRIDDPRFDAARAVALSAATDPDLAREVRELALSGSLGPRETDDLIRGQMQNPETREATWAWFQANYSKLVVNLPTQWRRRTPDYAQSFCNAQKVKDLQTFFEEVGHLAPGYQRALAQTSETIELCAALKETRAQELIDALQVG